MHDIRPKTLPQTEPVPTAKPEELPQSVRFAFFNPLSVVVFSLMALTLGIYSLITGLLVFLLAFAFCRTSPRIVPAAFQNLNQLILTTLLLLATSATTANMLGVPSLVTILPVAICLYVLLYLKPGRVLLPFIATLPLISLSYLPLFLLQSYHLQNSALTINHLLLALVLVFAGLGSVLAFPRSTPQRITPFLALLLLSTILLASNQASLSLSQIHFSSLSQVFHELAGDVDTWLFALFFIPLAITNLTPQTYSQKSYALAAFLAFFLTSTAFSLFFIILMYCVLLSITLLYRTVKPLHKKKVSEEPAPQSHPTLHL